MNHLKRIYLGFLIFFALVIFSPNLALANTINTTPSSATSPTVVTFNCDTGGDPIFIYSPDGRLWDSVGCGGSKTIDALGGVSGLLGGSGTWHFVANTNAGACLTNYIPNSVNNYADALADACFTSNIINFTYSPVPTEPITVTFDSSADTYVRSGQTDRNLGAGVFMRLQSSGDNRSLVKFDQTAMQTTIGNKEVLSAKLRVTIVDNGNNWGTTGRTIDAHRLIANWAEGNGTEADRGTGLGATWNCTIDSLIENQAKNCSGTTEWEMGQPNNPAVHPWVQTASATQNITNNQSGVVEFDVTDDVASFLNSTNQNYGWIIKKTNEGQNGQVSFGTKESASVPQLVVTYQP